MIESLEKIVQGTPGAIGAVLMGMDGIAVEQYVDPEASDGGDIESVAMEFSFRFIELRAAAESLEMGSLSDISLKADHGTMLVRFVAEEYFVAVLLRDAGHFGKGRYLLRNATSKLAAELV